MGLDIEKLDRTFKVSPVRLAKHNFSAAELEHLEGELSCYTYFGSAARQAALPSNLGSAICNSSVNHDLAPSGSLNTLALAGLEGREAQQQHFLRIWNLKEAFCKAQGLGIISTMRHHTFSISRAPDGMPAQLDPKSGPCCLQAGNEENDHTVQSLLDTQPAWQVKIQPSCDHAYLSVFDVDEAHTAAVCMLGPAGSVAMDTSAAAPVTKHFWPRESTAYLQTLRPGRQITGSRIL